MLVRDFVSESETVKESLRDINDPAMLKSTIEKNGRRLLKHLAEFIAHDINSNREFYKNATNASSSIRSPWLAIVKYDINGITHEIQLKFNSQKFSVDCKLDGGESVSIPDLGEEFFTYDDYVDNGLSFDEMAYDDLAMAIDNPNQNNRPQSNRRFTDSDFDGFF